MQDDSAGNDVSRMMVGKKRSGGRSFFLALMITTAMVGVPRLADQALAQAAPGAAAKTSFNIRPQPLSQALVQFSNSTGVQLFFNADLARGINSQGAQGSLTRIEALGRILAGSGLTYKFTNASTVSIQKPTSGSAAGTVPGAIALDTIDVQGGSADGTVGYVASRTTAGTKTDTPLIEIPQTINVVTRDQISNQNAQDVMQALRYTPGVQSETYGVGSSTTGYAAFNVRGWAQDGTQGYVNGLKQNMPGYVNGYLLDRVDVIKGPASILYGQATPGGIVDATTKLANGQRIREVQLQAGSYSNVQGAFDIGDVINNDPRFSFRLAGVAYTAKSQVDFEKEQQISIAPSFRFRPDDDTDLTVWGIYQKLPHSFGFHPLPASGTVLPNPNGRISRSLNPVPPDWLRNDQETARVGYNFSHRFNDVVTFNSKTSYNYLGLLDSQQMGAGTLSAPDFTTLQQTPLKSNALYNVLSTDNNVVLNFNTGFVTHKVITGIDYQHTNYAFNEGLGTPIPLNVFAPNNARAVTPIGTSDVVIRQRLEQLGVYAQDQIKIGKLSILAGIRQDWARTYDHSTVFGDTSITDQTSHALTWRAGAIYDFENGIAPYVSYSTSFQPNVGSSFDGKAFDPTNGKQLEVGIKYQPVGWKSFLTASLFDITQTNVLTPDSAPTHLGFSVQSGEVRSRGLELAANAQISDNFKLIAGYTYLDAKVTKSNDINLDKTPVAVPSHQFSLWGDYTIDSGVFDGLGFGAGVRYTGSTWGDATNTIKVPDFTLVDAAIHYDLGKANPSLTGLRLDINATNLFDKTYVAACNFAAACYYGQGRIVTGRLTYRW